jgi:tetratricopeptide (TPR) repeat protein
MKRIAYASFSVLFLLLQVSCKDTGQQEENVSPSRQLTLAILDSIQLPMTDAVVMNTPQNCSKLDDIIQFDTASDNTLLLMRKIKLGHIYLAQDALEKAESLYSDALKFANSNHDTLHIAASKNGLGLVEAQRDSLKTALSFFNEAGVMFQAVYHYEGQVACQANIARLYQRDRQPQIARYHLDIALEMCREFEIEFWTSLLFIETGTHFRWQSMPDSAKFYFDFAMASDSSLTAESLADLSKRIEQRLSEVPNVAN